MAYSFSVIGKSGEVQDVIMDPTPWQEEPDKLTDIKGTPDEVISTASVSGDLKVIKQIVELSCSAKGTPLTDKGVYQLLNQSIMYGNPEVVQYVIDNPKLFSYKGLVESYGGAPKMGTDIVSYVCYAEDPRIMIDTMLNNAKYFNITPETLETAIKNYTWRYGLADKIKAWIKSNKK